MISRKTALASWVILGILSAAPRDADASHRFCHHFRHHHHHSCRKHHHHRHHHLCRKALVQNLSSTFYDDDGISANNYTYRQNDARFGYCIACNTFRLGDIVQLPSRGGGYIRAVNVDHIGSGSALDMHRKTARVVMGHLSIGRMQLCARLVGHINCMKHHLRRN